MAEGQGVEGALAEGRVYQFITPTSHLDMPAFDRNKCSWKVYNQVFANKMKIHDIEASKWPMYFLSFVGFEIMTLLSELCYPDKIENKSYEDIVRLVQDQLEPEPSELAETYRFMQRNQKENESIADYSAALKRLAKTCNFGTYLERALRDKFAHGLSSKSVVKKLFTIHNITFSQAVKLAMLDELADKEATMITGNIYADRMTRWALILCSYNYKIEYRKSCHNANADFPSRLPIQVTQSDIIDSELNQPTINNVFIDIPPVTHEVIAKATSSDPLLSKVYSYIESGWPKTIDSQLLSYKGKELELYLVKGVITWRGRTVIPQKLREQLLKELHIGHLGTLKMKALAKGLFWWPNISLDIEKITQNCEGCLLVRNKPELKPLHSWEWPNKPWQRIHADFAGPFLGHMWLLVVDAHSKWPEVVKMNKATAELTINCLRSIFARFGLPEQLVTDNGPQFISEEFQQFCNSNNIRHICTAPYHPASNGQAERTVQTFKRALLASKFDKDDYHKKLLSWLLSYRTAPHASTGKTPCELMFGRSLRTRLSLVKTSIIIPQKQQLPSKQIKCFLPGDKVQVSMYNNNNNKWLQGKVVEPIGNVMYKVATDKGNFTRNVTQMLPIRKSVDKREMESDNFDNEPSNIVPSSVSVDPSISVPSPTATPTPPVNPITVRRSSRVPKPRQILDL